MKKTITFLAVAFAAASLFTACSSAGSQKSESSSVSVPVPSAVSSRPDVNGDRSTAVSYASAAVSADAASETGSSSVAEKTKDYILNGQGDVSNAQRLTWNPDFLNEVDIASVYQQYLKTGGKANDIPAFATYLTQNAPVPENWKQMFEADLLKKYGEKVNRYEPLSGYPDSYQVYVEEIPDKVYVVVNARTGNFHG